MNKSFEKRIWVTFKWVGNLAVLNGLEVVSYRSKLKWAFFLFLFLLGEKWAFSWENLNGLKVVLNSP